MVCSSSITPYEAQLGLLTLPTIVEPPVPCATILRNILEMLDRTYAIAACRAAESRRQHQIQGEDVWCKQNSVSRIFMLEAAAILY